MLSDKELKAIKLRKFRCHEKLIESKFELYDDLAKTLIVNDMPKLFQEIERLKTAIKDIASLTNYGLGCDLDEWIKERAIEALGGDTLESPK